MQTKRVAVIGAGVCGLVSIKSCLEEGLQPVCYEQHSDIGGVWIYDEELRPNQGSSVYQSLVTNSSKEMTCFSDFPMSRETPPYVPQQTYLRYVRDYADHFKLRPYVNFDCTIVRVEPASDYVTTGKWEVRIRRRGNNQDDVEIFDGVIVCSGMFKDATLPKYPGMDQFQGEMMHSNAFRSGSKFAGKNVLVVGGGHSAGDVSVDSSRFASQVYLSMRNGTWVVPRIGLGGVPSDMMGNTRFVSKLPDAIRGFMVTTLASSKVNHDKAGLLSKATSFFSGSQMVNDEIGSRIYCGKIKTKPAISRFTKTGAEFEDGSLVEGVDAVIFATGYHLGYKFIDNAIIADSQKDLELYEYVFPARLKHPTLAVVGCVAVLGANVPVYELQARWAARVFSGKAKLPGPTQRVLQVKRRKEQTFRDYGRHKLYVPPVPLQEYYAKQIGAQPRLLSLLFSDPKFAFKCFFGPAYPTTYRLHGPGAWSGARSSIEEAWDNVISATRTRVVVKETKDPQIILKIFVIFTIVLVILTHFI